MAVYAYWDLRGLGEPCRYLLHYVGADFEDKRYKKLDEWLDEKFKLGLDFPNLPYYIDGDVKITQSLAILRYLARKYDLAGKTDEQKLRIEVAEQQIIDFRSTFTRLCYSPKFETELLDVVKNLPGQVKLLSDFLGDKKFLGGNDVTYIDFLAYDAFDFYKYVAPGYMNDFPTVKAYHDRVGALSQLQSYLKSDSYTRWPIVGPMAHFGGKGPEPKRD